MLIVRHIANLERDATTPSPRINHLVKGMGAVCRD
jgi:hypothetical protein